MELYILNPQYEIIGVIDAAESQLWNKKYNDEGYCEIYYPCDDMLLSLLQKGNYVFRYDDDMFCKIKTVEIETDVENGNYIIATAKDMCTILAGRIVRWNTVYSGTVGGFIKKLLTDNVVNPKLRDGTLHTVRQIPNFVVDFNESDFTEKIEVSTFTDDLLSLIITTCKTYGIGFRVAYDITAGKIKFRLYRGKNKASTTASEYVEFSPSFSNIISTHYKTDDANYKNVVYVGYKTDADTTELLSLYNGSTEPQGEEREEIYVDGTGTSREITLEDLQAMFGTNFNDSKGFKTSTTWESENLVKTIYWYRDTGANRIVANSEKKITPTEGEENTEKITVSDYTYLLLIRIVGEKALAERVKTQEFSGEVDTSVSYIYKADFDLGDIVKVINEYGIEAEAQITEILESEDNEDGYTVEPTFEFKN